VNFHSCRAGGEHEQLNRVALKLFLLPVLRRAAVTTQSECAELQRRPQPGSRIAVPASALGPLPCPVTKMPLGQPRRCTRCLPSRAPPLRLAHWQWFDHFDFVLTFQFPFPLTFADMSLTPLIGVHLPFMRLSEARYCIPR